MKHPGHAVGFLGIPGGLGREGGIPGPNPDRPPISGWREADLKHRHRDFQQIRGTTEGRGETGKQADLQSFRSPDIAAPAPAPAAGQDTAGCRRLPAGFGQQIGVVVLNPDTGWLEAGLGLSLPAEATGPVSSRRCRSVRGRVRASGRLA
jgi:hypothetical protein